MGGVNGMGGARLSFFRLKWHGIYWNIAEGGWIGGIHHGSTTGDYGFAGGDLGWLKVWGNNQLTVGTLLEFAINEWGTGCATGDCEESSKQTVGFGFGPIIQYYRYWGRFGLGMGIEWPIVVGGGSDHISTMPPIVTLSVGM